MKRLTLAFALMPLVALCGLVEDVRDAYDTASAAVANLEQFKAQYNPNDLLDAINEQIDRLEEEHYRIINEGDALKEKGKAAIAAFSSMDLPELDRSALSAAQARHSNALTLHADAENMLASLVSQVVSMANAANSWGNDYASWHWLYQTFGLGIDYLPPQVLEDFAENTECGTNCSCMDSRYQSYRYNGIYRVVAQNLKGWVYDNGNWTQNHGEIPQ